MRYCLNVHGVMLCDGPQHHEGGCTFTQGWQLARKLEDELASIAGYAGDTTNELRETRERAEAAEARCARLQQALAELRDRAGREPLAVDISDYSDEWCAGFLAGQENALDEALAGPDTPAEIRKDLSPTSREDH